MQPRTRFIAWFTAATAIGVSALSIMAAPSGAIVSGNDANITDVPWQVALLSGDEQFCGGTIVAADTIVTAAHCVQDEDASSITVLAGVSNLNEAGATASVAQVIAHPDYASQELSDIAVLKLTQPLPLSDMVSAIELATTQDVAQATTGVVSGWGARSEHSDDYPTQLQQATVPLVDDAICDLALGGIDATSEACAGGAGADSCYGDSGGPLAIKRSDGTYALAGVVSWGEECGGSTPGVYADVPGLTAWLAQATRANTATNDAQATTPEATANDDAPVESLDATDDDGSAYTNDDPTNGDDWGDTDWASDDWDDTDWMFEEWDESEWDDDSWHDACGDFDDELLAEFWGDSNY